MQWAKGAELKVEARKETNGATVTVDLPNGVTARVLVPTSSSRVRLLVNGAARSSTDAQNGTRKIIIIGTAGHYDLKTE